MFPMLSRTEKKPAGSGCRISEDDTHWPSTRHSATAAVSPALRPCMSKSRRSRCIVCLQPFVKRVGHEKFPFVQHGSGYVGVSATQTAHCVLNGLAAAQVRFDHQHCG